MSLSKSKSWYSNNCLHFLNHCFNAILPFKCLVFLVTGMQDGERAEVFDRLRTRMFVGRRDERGAGENIFF